MSPPGGSKAKAVPPADNVPRVKQSETVQTANSQMESYKYSSSQNSKSKFYFEKSFSKSETRGFSFKCSSLQNEIHSVKTYVWML